MSRNTPIQTSRGTISGNHRRFVADWTSRNLRVAEPRELSGILKRLQALPEPVKTGHFTTRQLLKRAQMEEQRRNGARA